jgi:hypothetical protein
MVLLIVVIPGVRQAEKMPNWELTAEVGSEKINRGNALTSAMLDICWFRLVEAC